MEGGQDGIGGDRGGLIGHSLGDRYEAGRGHGDVLGESDVDVEAGAQSGRSAADRDLVPHPHGVDSHPVL